MVPPIHYVWRRKLLLGLDGRGTRDMQGRAVDAAFAVAYFLGFPFLVLGREAHVSFFPKGFNADAHEGRSQLNIARLVSRSVASLTWTY